MVMKISEEEREKRIAHINYAIASVELEGEFKPSEDQFFKELADLYINGEIDSKELKALVFKKAKELLNDTPNGN